MTMAAQRIVLAGALLVLAGCGPRHEPPPLVLLVTVDSLRFDRLGAHGSRLDLSPNIDALAHSSELFSTTYAASPTTLPSLAALHSGRYPSRIGVLGDDASLRTGTETLATALAAHGFDTRAVVSARVLRAESGLAAGFAVYDDEFPGAERTAPDTTDAALRQLEACTADASTPCFLWVHYQDPDGPYRAPGELAAQRLEDERRAPDGRRLLPVADDDLGLGGIPVFQVQGDEREVAWYRAAYDAEVAHVDEHLGRLLDEIADRGLKQRALVVFTSDHGEALGERDVWFSHGEHLDDPVLRVPLFIRRPGAEPDVRNDPVSHVDLLPTVLALATGAAPDPDRPGRDLFAEGAERKGSTPFLAALGRATVPRFGLVRGNYKLVMWRPDGGQWLAELYRSGQEPANIAAEQPEIVDRLVQDLLALQGGE